MTLYADWMQMLLPGGLSGRWARAWVRAQGETLDDYVTLARDAVFTGGVTDPENRGRQCADDALPYHGRDAQVPRAPGETLDAWRARIAAAWDTWSTACTEGGVLDAVELLGYGRPVLLTQRELPVDGYASLWARFALIFPEGSAIEGADPAVWVPALRATLRTWRSHRDRVSRVVLAFDADLVGYTFICGTSLCGGAAETYDTAALCGSLICGSDAAGVRYFD